MAFNNIDPWGEERADLRAGTVASVVANCHGADTKPSDFLPRYGAGEPVEMTDEQIQAAVMKANAMLGGAVSR